MDWMYNLWQIILAFSDLIYALIKHWISSVILQNTFHRLYYKTEKIKCFLQISVLSSFTGYKFQSNFHRESDIEVKTQSTCALLLPNSAAQGGKGGNSVILQIQASVTCSGLGILILSVHRFGPQLTFVLLPALQMFHLGLLQKQLENWVREIKWMMKSCQHSPF